MPDKNYERVLERISKVSGLDKSEIERRVEAKRAKLSGLISKDGAAQIIAAELGISFDNEVLKIEELLAGMRKVNVVGKVINLFPVRNFTNKNGDESKVLNFILADETSNIKVVLWDTNHISLIENGNIGLDSVVEINNGSMRTNEIHLGSFSEIKPSQKEILNVVRERVVRDKNIADFKISEGVRTRAFIVQSFEPKFFHVCPDCNKKAVSGINGFNCETHGNVFPSKRAILNLVIDDGTETIRAVVFHEKISQLGFTGLDEESLKIPKDFILGKEMIFEGNVKMNNFFNNPELIIDNIRDVDVDGLIATLEKPQ